MRKLGFLLGMVLLLSLTAAAQDSSKAGRPRPPPGRGPRPRWIGHRQRRRVPRRVASGSEVAQSLINCCFKRA